MRGRLRDGLNDEGINAAAAQSYQHELPGVQFQESNKRENSL